MNWWRRNKIWIKLVWSLNWPHHYYYKYLLNSTLRPGNNLESDRMLSLLHYLSILEQKRGKLSVRWWILIIAKLFYLFLFMEGESCLTIWWFSKFNKAKNHTLNSDLRHYNEAKNFAYSPALNTILYCLSTTPQNYQSLILDRVYLTL